MSDETQTTPDNVQAARDSFNGRGLTESQFQEAWAISGIIHGEIQKTGSFREKLTDYAHAFARGEKFDALKGEASVRDVFKGRYNESMNQMREALIAREEQVIGSARPEIAAQAERVGDLIQSGETMPFYKAYDQAAVELADKLDITQSGAKAMMKDVFKAQQGCDLYQVGKDLEEAYHKPVREAEIAARKAEKLETHGPQRTPSQSMG